MRVSLIVVSARHKPPELVRLRLSHLAAIRTAPTSPSLRLPNEQNQAAKSLPSVSSSLRMCINAHILT
jgi:hypothetical protein